jgi:hypothetical protein
MSIRYQEAETETALDLLIIADRASLFWEKFNALGEDCQELLRMSFEEKPTEEIQEALGFSNEGSVRVKKFKCKERLTKMITGDRRYTELKT